MSIKQEFKMKNEECKQGETAFNKKKSSLYISVF